MLHSTDAAAMGVVGTGLMQISQLACKALINAQCNPVSDLNTHSSRAIPPHDPGVQARKRLHGCPPPLAAWAGPPGANSSAPGAVATLPQAQFCAAQNHAFPTLAFPSVISQLPSCRVSFYQPGGKPHVRTHRMTTVCCEAAGCIVVEPLTLRLLPHAAAEELRRGRRRISSTVPLLSFFAPVCRWISLQPTCQVIDKGIYQQKKSPYSRGSVVRRELAWDAA